jgi:hypothetical protein
MSTESGAPAEPPVMPYRPPALPPPVTRAERLAVLSGYVLLAGGLLALPWLINRNECGKLPLWLAMSATVLGAAITASCYIANAIRRL